MKEQEQNQNEETKTVELNQNFVEKYRNIIIGISVGIIVIVAGLYFYRNQQQEKSKQSAVALTRISGYYENDLYEKALNGDPDSTVRGEKIIGLLDIVNKFGGTSQASVAALYAGNCYINMQDYESAKKYFEKARSSESQIVKLGAMSGLGIIAEKNQDYQSAAKFYSDAAEISSDENTKSRYKFYSALSYEKQGESEKAIEIYREIVDKSATSEFADLSKNGIARIGMKIE